MNDSMYYIQENKLYIKIPVKNNGKFRWKNRKNYNKYGIGFATLEIPYSKDSYVEWQIGYDVPVRDYKKDPSKKPTSLYNLVFAGSNGVEKHPYELSEFLYAMIQANIVTKEEMLELIMEIDAEKTSFQDEFQIETKNVGEFNVDGFNLKKQEIALPTFMCVGNDDEPIIEISIQKQQHASSVQPMLYFSIPISALSDYEKMVGKTANDINFDYTTLVIDNSNKNIILNLFKLFGICSDKHKHDIEEILRLLVEN